MKLFFLFAAMLAMVCASAIAEDSREPADADIFELCQFFMGPPAGGDNNWASKIGCSNSGIRPAFEVSPVVRTPLGAKLNANRGAVLYREDLAFEVSDAVLTAPVTVEASAPERTLPAGVSLRKHKVNKSLAWCWFDLQPFTREEMQQIRIRTSVMGSPPFEAVCMQDANKDGVFETGLHRKRGEIKFRKFKADAGYESKNRVLIPIVPDGYSMFGEAGEPIASRYIYYGAAPGQIALIVQSKPGGAALEISRAPIIGDTAEVSIRGVKFVFSSIKMDAVEYSVSGRLEPWIEFY